MYTTHTYVLSYVFFAVGWNKKVKETLITLNSCYTIQGTILGLIAEKIQINLLLLYKTQVGRKTSLKINRAG